MGLDLKFFTTYGTLSLAISLCSVGCNFSVRVNALRTFESKAEGVDPCMETPIPGTVCKGGAVYLGTLSWGSSSVTSGETDRYMITPGGCGAIPDEQVGGGKDQYSYWPIADFTPICSGTDDLEITWNNGDEIFYDIPTMTNFPAGPSVGNGSINTDDKYGSENADQLVSISAVGQGGYHAAARYCNKLDLGGYTDWYLPNRYELNLIYSNKAAIPGINTVYNPWYWSSSEVASGLAATQNLSDGTQYASDKFDVLHIRCVRRF